MWAKTIRTNAIIAGEEKRVGYLYATWSRKYYKLQTEIFSFKNVQKYKPCMILAGKNKDFTENRHL